MWKILTGLLFITLATGCSINRLPNNLSVAMMNQDATDIVATGAPAYLLLLDALILTYPDDEGYLLAGARLYSAYAGTFTADDEQAQLLADKALDYSKRALCAHGKKTCGLFDLSLSKLQEATEETLTKKHLNLIYTSATTWASWIQAHSDDWNAIAQLGKVKTLLAWAESIDSSYDSGMLQVYLGVLETQLPPSVGGQPELGRQHFEKAIEVSHGDNLMAYVMFAKQYARLMFEQELHDELLNKALKANPNVHGLTLINRLAQQEAAYLLADSANYFE